MMTVMSSRKICIKYYFLKTLLIFHYSNNKEQLTITTITKKSKSYRKFQNYEIHVLHLLIYT